ncbi:DNA polymerase II large subunit [Candidatus Woesearchaeota archaeon]|nr:DNA polymerase II large subunit [Candidatus Woesearchaeota archaeon]
MSEQSKRMEKYFSQIEKRVGETYSVCSQARKKGFDPEDKVSIPLAKNMAERVEGLISVVQPELKDSGISDRIQKLEKKYGKLSWKVALAISLETAQERFCKFDNKLKAMETGIRIGLAYLTLGVVASPIEGFVELKLKKRNDDGKEYFCLMFSGPIRSAGGTAGAVSVLIADYVRKKMGYAKYDPTESEARRAITELNDYHERITNLQYLPSEEEIKFMAENLPVQIAGDASEKIEVSNYKDIPRIETNIIRNGFCLVMGECLCQKAPKLWKQLSTWGHEFELDQWDFLGRFVRLQKDKRAKVKEAAEGKIQPDYTYVKDLVAGRPILGFPLRNGAFRLRYGRCRNTGYSSTAIHPALTYILDKYIAVGTQLKLERPGKAASISTCDSIEGPLVKLKSGEVLRINDAGTAKRLTKDVEEIIYLGDMLINYGDFFNRAHVLVPPGYCEEWWLKELERAIVGMFGSLDYNKASCLVDISEDIFRRITDEKHNSSIDAESAIKISKSLKIPLHPRYTYYWNSISKEDLGFFLDTILHANIVKNDKGKAEKIVFKHDKKNKRIAEILGIAHKAIGNEYFVVLGDDAVILDELFRRDEKKAEEAQPASTNIEMISQSCGLLHRDRGGTFIGARMGRPEKAKVRKLAGQPHCLFPVGAEGGRLRCFQSCLEKSMVNSDFPIFSCKCGNETVFGVCEKCGSKTRKMYFCNVCGITEKDKCTKHGHNSTYYNRKIDICSLFGDVLGAIGMDIYPDLIKGVRGTSNKDHIPEHLAKGILRARHDVPVNKDGTTRYDMTQLAITHFKPAEIKTPIEMLRQLGYEKDIYGADLTDENQVVELLPQDVILPSCIDAPEKGANEMLFNVANFIDELLTRLYKLKPIYNLEKREDLVGHLVIALAPHTSAGIVARIIGFSQTQGYYAHPMLHAATRRDCDGDEASVTLLADALLNFSRQYLPNTRGATQDAPLILTYRLIPSEVDDMLFDLDTSSSYPLEFYEAAMKYEEPWKIEIDQLGKRLNTEKQYEGMFFTHDTSNINSGVKCSAYKLLPSMEDKLKGQMNIASKIRAVDESQVAKIVIEKHFIKDIKGNLRKFSQQQFRCVDCNEKYRRPPLLGKCSKCGGKIIFTVSEGSIVKYLEPALSLAQHYRLPPYLVQSLELTKRRVEGIFGREKDRQEALNRWFD